MDIESMQLESISEVICGQVIRDLKIKAVDASRELTSFVSEHLHDSFNVKIRGRLPGGDYVEVIAASYSVLDAYRDAFVDARAPKLCQDAIHEAVKALNTTVKHLKPQD